MPVRVIAVRIMGDGVRKVMSQGPTCHVCAVLRKAQVGI